VIYWKRRFTALPTVHFSLLPLGVTVSDEAGYRLQAR